VKNDDLEAKKLLELEKFMGVSFIQNEHNALKDLGKMKKRDQEELRLIEEKTKKGEKNGD